MKRRTGDPAKLMVLSCGLAALVTAACADPAPSGPWSDWTTLRLEAGATISGSFEMRRLDEGRCLETEARASVIGIQITQSNTETRFDPETGAPASLITHSRDRARRYVFDRDGYTVEKLRSTEESEDDLDTWEVRLHREFRAPLGRDGKPARLFDYYGMLLHLREAALDAPGDEVEIWVATSDGPEAYRIRVDEVRGNERVFTDADTGLETTAPIREFRLAVAPADPSKTEAGFLDMEGEVEIWVEAMSKTLLEISGKVPKAGRVRLVLDSIGVGS
jgi:hypothetical protein